MTASQENSTNTGTDELPETLLADILRTSDPEGCDQEWSYEPQAKNILNDPRFLELCRKTVEGQNEG